MRTWVGAALLVPSLLAAGDAAAGPLLNHELPALPAPGALVIDGDLADWDLSGAIVMTDDQDEPRHLVRVAAMYDAAGMYLGLQFRDPTPMGNRIDPARERGRAWGGDCVQLRFNTGPRPSEAPVRPFQILHVDAYWFAPGHRPTAYAVHADMSPGGAVQSRIDEAEGHGVQSGYRADADGRGYCQELRLDWALIHPGDAAPAKAGDELHLAIEAMWGDPRFLDHPASRVTDLLDRQRPERDMIWANPQAFGSVRFLAAGRVAPTASGARWAELLQRNAALVEAAPVAVPHPVAPDQPCAAGSSPVAERLNAWYAAGTAAGNAGDVYDNRDREHAAIRRGDFPQLRSQEYGPDEKALDQDYGLFQGVRSPVTFGNSSTAAQPERGGCNPRTAMMAPTGLLQLHAQYRGSNLFVYPAHHDFRPGRSGHGFYGDLLPVNQPYVLLSLGSSGSDIPFLNAAIHACAALAPQVKRELVRQGLLMPTLQALLRRTSRAVQRPEDYFAGAAHPAVFDGSQLDEERLVAEAHALTLAAVPPLAEIRAEVATPLRPGVDAPATAGPERVFVSPGAVGFVFRRWTRELPLVADAGDSCDLQGRPLEFRWAVLQGDPSRIRIAPEAGGRRARITVAWHGRFAIQPGSAIAGNRVDIGVFAGNGSVWSVPAFISVLCPDNEERTYDGDGRLLDVDGAAMDTEIGQDTTCLLPAEGVPPYDIRDWPALLQRLGAGPEDPLASLAATAFAPAEAARIAALGRDLAARAQASAAQLGATPPGTPRGRRWADARQAAEQLSRPLLEAGPEGAAPLKARIEGLLNAWQDDAEWFVAHQAAFSRLAGQAPAERRQRFETAVARLVGLGILAGREGAWTLHAWRRGAGGEAARLTAAERGELRRLHLLIESDLLLPGVLERTARRRYADPRLGLAPPQWICFGDGVGDPPPGQARVRAMAEAPPAVEFEQP